MVARTILTGRAGRALVVTVAVAGLAAGALVAADTSATAAGGTNLVVNPSFEGSGAGDLAGWAGTTAATVSLVNGGAASGSFSAKVAFSGSTPGGFAINGVAKAAKSVPKGQVFRATAKLRVPVLTGKPVCLQLLEQTATGTVQTVSRCITATGTGWQSFAAVSLTTKAAGSGVSYRIREASGAAGHVFQVDAVSVVNADVTAPAAVTGAKAVVNGANKVTLSWTKASGAYAYKVFRNHKTTPTATVVGASTWADTGVTEGNHYSYQVQAVDFAGNASALTKNVLATTPWVTAGVATSYWPMDETSGATMHDIKGENDGNLEHVLVGQPGFSNTSYWMGGAAASSQIIVPDSPTLNPGPSRVKMGIRIRTAWVPATPDFDLMRKGVAPGDEYKMELQPNGQISCTFDGTLDHLTLFAGPRVDDAKWHTIECTKESTSITLSIDGVSWTKTVSIGDIDTDPARDLIFGAYPDFEFYHGYLDNAYFRLG